MTQDKFGTGAIKDLEDSRDYKYEDIMGAYSPLTEDDWKKGYDIEEKLNFKLPIKNQKSSESCVGMAFSYYLAILNLVETGKYDSVSAKAIYSQIFLPQGGSMFRDGAKLVVDWGALPDEKVSSNLDTVFDCESFMRDKSWITPEITEMAKALASKEYRLVTGMGIDIFAQAIRDGWGIVAGVEGVNNGTWMSNEPQPPVDKSEWAHCLYFGKFGIDEKGKYIATPNSWGDLGCWQKLRENYFINNNRFVFNPWTLIDKPNNIPNMDTQKFLLENDLKFVRNQTTGQFGRIIGGKLRTIENETSRGALLLLDDKIRNGGINISDSDWGSLPKLIF